MTGWAALRMYGGGYFDGLDRDGLTPRAVRLVVPRGGNLRRWGLTEVERAAIAASEIRVLHGVPCTSALRAVFDAARSAADQREAVVVVDMALAAGLISLDAYLRYAFARRGWPGARRARSAALLADPRSLSPQETLMRLIWVLDARLPTPRSNWPVSALDGRRLGRPDLLCDELGVIGEYDGAGHRRRSRHRADVARDQAFRDAGLESFVVVGGDIEDTCLVVDRMKAAVLRAQQADRPRRWRVARDPGPA